MEQKQTHNYVSNSMWILLEKASRIISGILVGVLVVRYLGDVQYGIISYGLSLIGVLTVISTLGLDGLVVRELVTRPKEEAQILGTSFGLRLLGSLLVVVLAVAWSALRDPAETTLIVFLLSLSIVFQSLTVIDFQFQAKVQGKYTAMNQVITLFSSAFVKLLLIYFNAPLIWFACMAALEAGLSALNQWRFYHRQGGNMKLWKFIPAEAKFLLILALPQIISSFIQMLYLNADSILITRLLRDMGQVGQYNAGIRISQAAYFIPIAICAAVFPGIVNNRNNRELQVKRLTQLYSIMLYGALTIIAGAMLLGDWVIALLYGPKFPDAISIFKLHVWLSIPVFWGTAWGMWMLAENKQKYVVGMQIIMGITILGADWFLIPKFGIKGAAIALLAGYYLAQVYMLIAWKPKENVSIFLRALNPINLLEVVKYSRKS